VLEAAHAKKLTTRKKPADALADVEAQMYEPGYSSYL
jgi:hypothetical protein